MSTALAIPASAMSSHLVALTPSDVTLAQQQLRGWCVQKIIALGRDLSEHRQNLRHARAHKWPVKAWQSLERKAKAQMVYYAKIKKAVEAGFLVIPNFPIETIAVRVREGSKPKQLTAHYDSSVNKVQPTALLPSGHGVYVDEITSTQYHQNWNKKLNDGKGGWEDYRRTGSYNTEVDFPVAIIKPVILEATTRAMALRIFDRIGLANHGGGTQSRAMRKSDPIIIGQIINPKSKGRWNEQTVSFFIAWWLDMEAL